MVDKYFFRIIYIIEVVIAVIITAGMMVGIFQMSKQLLDLYLSTNGQSYDAIKTFLSLGLMIVIGIELVLVLLASSTTHLMELILYAAAQKMLIYSDTMLDVLVAAVAIAIIFATKKYLLTRDDNKNEHIEHG
ncbi:hypothetical protein SAMN05421734_101305 [Pelagirhabdus alkalitolerans]|uniref:Phosphate-starvation-inducible E n=1 Tax=Pelagirhabdus alkalitolerans TaxID=1612202 RepID=A0A1G6GQ95_9BACI|nr:hypothetical protein [Pelagirhabdus alkalitolerans]SDB83386.1 hypothetical protein SAMN05421734_101305 [Pelagirhabdus alkalitolerans]